MHYLSTVYFFNQTLHVSGIFVAHHQELSVDCLLVGRSTDSQLTAPDDGLQTCPKYLDEIN